MTTQDFFAAMDADPTDRSVFFALADYLEECGLLEESQAWRLIAQSDREPMPPDEYTKRKWWWRLGCSCIAKEILSGTSCNYRHTSSDSANHITHKYILGMSLHSNPFIEAQHPDFGNTETIWGTVHISDSRSDAFQKLANRIQKQIKEGTLP